MKKIISKIQKVIEPKLILKIAEERNLNITTLLSTHHHNDHVGDKKKKKNEKKN